MTDEGGRKKMSKLNGSGYRGTDVFTGKCDVRLTKEKDMELTRLAERNSVSRSDVMRRALDDFLKFNSMDEE